MDEDFKSTNYTYHTFKCACGKKVRRARLGANYSCLKCKGQRALNYYYINRKQKRIKRSEGKVKEGSGDTPRTHKTASGRTQSPKTHIV